MEMFVLVLTALGVVFAGVQIYYARKQVSAPATPSPQVLTPVTSAEPECRFIAVEGFTNKMFYAEGIDVSRATISIDGVRFGFDGGDITPNRVFMMKGYKPGSYLFTAHFSFFQKPDSYDKRYAADMVLGDAAFYVVKWEPYTSHLDGSNTRYVSVEPISEAAFRQMNEFYVKVLPSCKALKPGVTLL